MVYSVYFIDIAGDQHTDCKFVSMTEAMAAIDRLVYGPGRLVVKEIKCVNAFDRLVWHYRDGVIWPDDPDAKYTHPTNSLQETT